MRVLHIYSGNLYGGIERMLVTFARTQGSVPEVEHEFALAFPGRLAEELRGAGATVHQIGAVRTSRPHTIWSARRALQKILRTGHYSGAICHGAWPHALFAKIVNSARLPLGFWAHGPAAGQHWTERWARRVKPEIVLCNSNFTLESMAKFWPGIPARVVHCPVENEQRELTSTERTEIRLEAQTPADAAVIVQIGRMERGKGQLNLLSALSGLRDRTGWHCWFIGGAQTPTETEYESELREAAVAAGLTGRVHFWGDRTDVRRLLAAADIFCHPAITPEGFGIVMVEALYAGLPVIATAIGGAREIVDETCGILVAPGDAEALDGALNELLSDAAQRAHLGGSAPLRAARVSDPVKQLELLRTTLADHFLTDKSP